MPSMPLEINEQDKLIQPSGKMQSEYASVTRTMIDGGLYIENEEKKDSDESAIQKITVKYDSLGKLRSSMEKLDLNEDDEEPKKDFYFSQEKNGSAENLTQIDTNNTIPYDNNEISDQELMQVETFFRSHKTSVYVCPSVTNMYSSSIEISTLSPAGKTGCFPRTQSNWQLVHTGIPVLLLDTGETRSRTKRRIQIVLAEKGTGFLLWKDTIDNLTNYKAVDNHFHTMFLSVDHRKMIGLSFNNVSAAREFYDRVEQLTSDPANISLSGPNSKAAKKAAAKKKKKVEKVKLPKKADISQPCCFQHVTKVDLSDRFVTLTTLAGTLKGAKGQAGECGPAKELQKYKSEPMLRSTACNNIWLKIIFLYAAINTRTILFWYLICTNELFQYCLFIV